MRQAPKMGYLRYNVPEVGVEPTRPFEQRIVSPPRLPFRHSGK